MSEGNILVVDDEPEIVQSLALRLRSKGYNVYTASDGLEATKTAINLLPDLIVLDIGMPAGSGHVVVERLSNISETSKIPIIFLTARVGEEDYNKAISAGIVKYITKPFDSDVLIAAIEEQMGRWDTIKRD